jgi:hypothetical protein
VKDNTVPKNAPPLDAIVGWEETYKTSQGVIARRMVWGQVRDFYYHPGDMDGHHLKGDYVYVLLQDGEDCFIHFDDILSINPAR